MVTKDFGSVQSQTTNVGPTFSHAFLTVVIKCGTRTLMPFPILPKMMLLDSSRPIQQSWHVVIWWVGNEKQS